MSVSARAGESIVSRDRGTLRAAITSAGLFCALVFAPKLGLPPLGMLAVLAPYPLTLARLTGGAASGWWTVLLGTALVGSIAPLGFALGYLLAVGAPALLMGEAVSRGRGLLRGGVWAFAWITSACAALLALAGPQLAAAILGSLDQMRGREILERMRAQGISLEQIDAWSTQATAWRDALAVLYPAFYVVLAGLAVCLNVWMVRRHLMRHDPAWLEAGEFEALRWPLAIVFVFVLAATGLLSPALSQVAANVLVLVAFLFVLQGLAVASFVGRRFLPAPMVWVLALVLALSQPAVPLAGLALLGLFDHWLDARRWAEATATDDD